MGTPMVAVDRVGRHFGEAVAVADVSFSVEAGRFLTILGPSGSGKTTLLRMIAGFITPTSGEIFIHGQPVSAVPVHKRSIGMVFQRLALFPHLTAWENVAYPLRMRRFDAREIPDRVARFFRLVRLEGLEKRRIHELSGGQQQRVAIARALVFEPDLVLLDEPLAALDRKLREEMQVEFRRIQQELGVTTINVTHDQREALVMSDEIMVMDRGHMLQLAPPGEVYRAPADAFVAAFLGLTNLWTAEVVAAAPEGLRLRTGDTEWHQPLTGGLAVRPGARVDCALRAERVTLLAGAAAVEYSGGRVRGEVQDVLFEGDRVVYEIRVPPFGGLVMRVIDRAPERHRLLERRHPVGLDWADADLHVFPGG